jgi:hypothetical protein
MAFVFLTYNDFAPNIRQEFRRLVVDDVTLETVENRVVNVAKSYMRSKYDVNFIFSRTAGDRDDTLIYHLVNMAIYQALEAVVPRQIPVTRVDAYDAARDYLRRLSLPSDHPEAIYPDFPLAEDSKPEAFRGDSGKRYENRF